MDFLSGDHPPTNSGNHGGDNNGSGGNTVSPGHPDLLSGLYTPYNTTSTSNSNNNSLHSSEDDSEDMDDEEADQLPPLTAPSTLDGSGRSGQHQVDREMQLAQRTNQIVSDYQNFLSELGGGDDAVGGVGGYKDEEFGTDTALQFPADTTSAGKTTSTSTSSSGMIHRSWRSDGSVNNGNTSSSGDEYLSPIPEDSSSSSGAPSSTFSRNSIMSGMGDGTWPDYPGLNSDYTYDYDKNRYCYGKKGYRYNFLGNLLGNWCGDRRKRKILVGCLIGICFVIVIAASSSSKKRDEQNFAGSSNINNNNGEGSSSITLDTNDPNFEIYQAVLHSPYQPIWYHRSSSSSSWQGKAYLQSLSFCESQNNRIPCPYSVYCPMGPSHPPLGGIQPEDNGSWAPIGEKANSWVQVGVAEKGNNSNNMEDNCQLYRDLHPDDPTGPQWGLTGENSEEVTRHLLCCIDPSDFPEGDAAEYMDSNVLDRPPILEDALTEDLALKEKDTVPFPEHDMNAPSDQLKVKEYYEPVWFDFKKYEGTSYQDGIEFCATQAGGRMICPYAAYCPDGYGRPPLEGVKSGKHKDGGTDGKIWAPFLGEDFTFGRERWVGIGPENQCQQLQVGRRPDGVIEGDENAMGYILCCGIDNMIGNEDGSGSSGNVGETGGNGGSSGNQHPSGANDSDSKNNDKSDSTAATSNSSNSNKEPAIHAPLSSPADQIKVKQYYEPKWYDSTLYFGSSYQDGVDFCSKISRNFMICPYAAYCPDGFGEPPLDGVRGREDVNIWAPMLGNDMSFRETWVGVGPVNTCQKLEEGRRPKEVVQEEEGAVGYVMCCNMDQWFSDLVGDGGSSNGGESGGNDASGSKTSETNAGNSNKDQGSSNGSSSNAKNEPEVPKVLASPTDVIAVKAYYEPKWFDSSKYTGTSYEEGVDFCANHLGGNHMMCPYAAYCPDGYGEPPLDGVKGTSDSNIWAPMLGVDMMFRETWVGVGPQNPCHKLEEGRRPQEVIHGDNDAMGYILCCLLDNWFNDLSNSGSGSSGSGIITSEQESAAKESNASTSNNNDTTSEFTNNTGGSKTHTAADQSQVEKYYQPLWYDSTSYSGKTYQDGIDFCGTQAGSLIMCPYEAYCPDGPGEPPLEGVRGTGDANIWSPMLGEDGMFHETWVGVGPYNPCQKLALGQEPEEVQKGTNEVVIMCCSMESMMKGKEDHGGVNQQGREGDISTTTGSGSSGNTNVESGSAKNNGGNDGSNEITASGATTNTSDTPSSTATNEQQTGDDHEGLEQYYEPIWFDPATYSGTTYQDAIDFCVLKAGNRIMCPYEAYCPDGKGKPPLEGVRGTSDLNIWAPMLGDDGMFHETWVGVGTGNQCQELAQGEKPEEVQKGTNEAHILCCSIEKMASGNKQGGNASTLSSSNVGSNTAQTGQTPQTEQLVQTSASNNNPATTVSNPSTEEEMDKNSQLVMKYADPQWFSRDSGWNGRTYHGAEEFCATKLPGSTLCPYVDACPDGTGNPPYPHGMPSEMNGEQWLPIAAPPNTWVLIGKGSDYEDKDLCRVYVSLHGQQAMFGLTGEMTEVKEHILCCTDSTT